MPIDTFLPISSASRRTWTWTVRCATRNRHVLRSSNAHRTDSWRSRSLPNARLRLPAILVNVNLGDPRIGPCTHRFRQASRPLRQAQRANGNRRQVGQLCGRKAASCIFATCLRPAQRPETQGQWTAGCWLVDERRKKVPLVWQASPAMCPRCRVRPPFRGRTGRPGICTAGEAYYDQERGR